MNGTVDTVLKDDRGGQSSLSDGADGWRGEAGVFPVIFVLQKYIT